MIRGSAPKVARTVSIWKSLSACSLSGRSGSSAEAHSAASLAGERQAEAADPGPRQGGAAAQAKQPSHLEWPILNFARDQVGSHLLPRAVFDVPVRRDILHRVVRWQRAKAQQGTHATKTRAQVRGGGRKPVKQKGTGSARKGTIRAPHMRGGGVTHGPHPRSHAHSLLRKMRRQGLACALSAKAAQGQLTLLDSMRLDSIKTKSLDTKLKQFLPEGHRRSVLLIDSSKNGTDGGAFLRKAAANLKFVDILPQEGLNVYSILNRDQLVLTPEAADAIAERVTRPIRRSPLDIKPSIA
ncbi:hypothetical protein WJX84_002040 [Apatococcus fuscideae]|uniref:Large ribosomal subunit protein uL4m n=1 Tax=Apatococcus fuscideae TaxID=2026836 RepID=A0AAW1T584_9CHLO